jgi:hypothetical protein
MGIAMSGNLWVWGGWGGLQKSFILWAKQIQPNPTLPYLTLRKIDAHREGDEESAKFGGLLRDVVFLGWPISALGYESKCWGRGGGEVAGSQPMSTAVHTGAQINFGDLTPYLTYGYMVPVRYLKQKIMGEEGAKMDFFMLFSDVDGWTYVSGRYI